MTRDGAHPNDEGERHMEATIAEGKSDNYDRRRSRNR